MSVLNLSDLTHRFRTALRTGRGGFRSREDSEQRKRPLRNSLSRSSKSRRYDKHMEMRATLAETREITASIEHFDTVCAR